MDIHQDAAGRSRRLILHPGREDAVFTKGRRDSGEASCAACRASVSTKRTYNYHGRTYDHIYHGYNYHGLGMHVYAPSRYYGRAYYGWAYNPWATPVHYRCGMDGQPVVWVLWRITYPYPVYPSAAFWLTDYLIASSLQSAYAAQQDGGEAGGNPQMGAAPLTPEVKQMIADEVRNQLALENQEAQQNAQQQDVDPGSSGIARIISDVASGHAHVFVVGTALDVVDNSGTECTLTDGDALLMNSAPAPDATAANVNVLASKGGQECPKGDTVSVGLNDLQEMQNHMRESIDRGCKDWTSEGQGGLPAAPVSPQSSAGRIRQHCASARSKRGKRTSTGSSTGRQAQNEVVSQAGQNGGGAAAAPTIASASRCPRWNPFLDSRLTRPTWVTG